MKFDFHLKSGKTVTIDIPDMDSMQDLVNSGAVKGDLLGGSNGIVFIEDVEAITVHAEPASPRTLTDADGDVWAEEAPDKWSCRDVARRYTLAEIKREFGPLKQDPR